jgi:hypothetical protein
VDEDGGVACLHIVRVEAGPFLPGFSQVPDKSTMRWHPPVCAGVRPGCRHRCRQQPCPLCGLPTGIRPAGAVAFPLSHPKFEQALALPASTALRSEVR